MKSNDTVLVHEDSIIMDMTTLGNDDQDLKYIELEKLCFDLQLTIRNMQQSMDEQNERMNLMSGQIHELKDELNVIKRDGIMIKKKDDIKEDGNKDKKSETMGFIKNKMYDGWSLFKEKVFKEQDIISFERSVWENIYHSLFSYFMNG